MDKKQVATSCFIGGVLLFCAPMFIQGAVIGIVFKISAVVALGIGALWLLAGDHISSMFERKQTAHEAVNVSKMYDNMSVVEIKNKGELEVSKRLAEAATFRAQAELEKQRLELRRIKVEEGRKSDLLARMGVDPFGAGNQQQAPKNDYLKSAKEGFDGTDEKPRKQLGDLRELF